MTTALVAGRPQTVAPSPMWAAGDSACRWAPTWDRLAPGAGGVFKSAVDPDPRRALEPGTLLPVRTLRIPELERTSDQVDVWVPTLMSLKGTFESIPGSFGSPSTRSPAMLRITSS